MITTAMESHPLTTTFDLVAQAHGGDEQALNRLFDRYYGRVLRVVRVRIGPKLRQRVEVEDVLQRTFLKAFQTFDRFEMRDEGSLLHWLAKLGENQIREMVDYYGAKKRDGGPQASLHGDPDQGRPRPDVADTTRFLPDRVAAAAEEHARLERALDLLPEPLRELIVLREFEGLAWQEIANLTGHPSPDAARLKHKRAMVELTLAMDRLAGDGADGPVDPEPDS